MTPVQLSPIQMLVSIGITGLMLAILSGSITCWYKFLFGKKRASCAQRPQATVGFIDVMTTVAVLVMLYASVVAAGRFILGSQESKTEVAISQLDGATSEDGDSSQNGVSRQSDGTGKQLTERQFVFTGFAMSVQLLCVILMSAFICARTGAAPKFLGWRTDQLSGDLMAGLRCFLMFTPLLLVFNAVLIQLTGIQYEHPVQVMLEKYPWLLGMAFWQACIVAPISEEFAFRSLLVGWFESIHFCKGKIEAWLVGLKVHDRADVQSTLSSFAINAPVVSNRDTSPYVAPLDLARVENKVDSQVDDQCQNNASDSDEAVRYRPPWWPAVLSGILFGLAHFSYGVSWTSLIIFGVILGRLYQLRQSLVPVILVHFMFNSMSILMFGVKLLLPEQMGE
jgi:membrane protease YdiL (CAAX protease family)